MKYDQGRSFPPTAQGAGLIFLVIAIFLFFAFPGQYFVLLVAYPAIWIWFSKTSINTDRIEEGVIKRKFGFFPFIFTRNIQLKNYDAAVIKMERVSYRTTQSIGFITLSSQDTPDSFVALNLKYKGRYEYEVLFKGTTKEIVNFIKQNLVKTELRFFDGVLKKEHEIIFE